MNIWTVVRVLNSAYYYYGVVDAIDALNRARDRIKSDQALNRADLLEALALGNFNIEVQR